MVFIGSYCGKGYKICLLDLNQHENCTLWIQRLAQVTWSNRLQSQALRISTKKNPKWIRGKICKVRITSLWHFQEYGHIDGNSWKRVWTLQGAEQLSQEMQRKRTKDRKKKSQGNKMGDPMTHLLSICSEQKLSGYQDLCRRDRCRWIDSMVATNGSLFYVPNVSKGHKIAFAWPKLERHAQTWQEAINKHLG